MIKNSLNNWVQTEYEEIDNFWLLNWDDLSPTPLLLGEGL
jgi:hypothetical protein